MPVETANPPLAASLRSPADGAADFTRLHITPLDADLLRIVVPASVLPRARNISYHSIETFPEKRYGFLELPQVEAEKITKRLHGSVLRGAKMKVEKARPEVQPEIVGDTEKTEKKKKKSKDADGSKKRKREHGVVEGVVLKERKVKRGWTEAPDTQKRRKSKKDKDSKDKKEKRSRTKSKYTEGEECLVKTVVPPNAMKNLAPEDVPRKRKKGKSREVTVHEFGKTTKFPSFLKDSADSTSGPNATEFVEGKGWVDADGNVVEPAKHKSRPTAEPKPAKEPKHKKAPVVEEDSDDTSSSGTSSEEEDSSSDAESKAEFPTAKKASEEPDTSDSSEEETSESPERKTPTSTLKEDSSRPTSSSSSRNLTIKIPPPATPAAKVHPLEALYKRQKPDADAPAQTPSQEAQPFSFFEAGEDDEEEPSGGPSIAVPMTPFTRQDLEWRTVRSAAPTPDTAHPSRLQNFWPSQEEEDEEMEEEADVDAEENGEQPPPGSSDFQSWFWENRRDLNRSWMGRRKAAAKEKRHRENKARASKVV